MLQSKSIKENNEGKVLAYSIQLVADGFKLLSSNSNERVEVRTFYREKDRIKIKFILKKLS